MDDLSLAELGEIESLRRTVKRLKPGEHALVGSGDDAAVVSATDSFLVSTDTLVENHDFKLEWSTGFDLGFKSVASNLADIAAMGATPTVLVVATHIQDNRRHLVRQASRNRLINHDCSLCSGASCLGCDRNRE